MKLVLCSKHNYILWGVVMTYEEAIPAYIFLCVNCGHEVSYARSSFWELMTGRAW